MVKLKVLDLFSGIGGFSLGLERTGGFETVAFCEIDPFCQKVLNKHWPDVPIYNDVREIDYEGAVDVITAGFPCQDVSTTGSQAGIGEGTRTGLFREVIRIAESKEFPIIIFENVSNFISGKGGEWFYNFLSSLSEVGYNAEWFCLTASSIGAPHERDRVWIVAYTDKAQLERGSISFRIYEKHTNFSDSCWGEDKPGVVRTLNGIPNQMDRVGALGNAVVPLIPEIIGNAILESISNATP